MSRPVALPTNLAKPSSEARYHIDYEWWQRSGQELNLYLAEHLCEDHRVALAAGNISPETVDWVDPVTGQVTQQVQLIYWLLSHCSRQPEYVTERTSLVDGVFRVLVATGNRPMSPAELARGTGRSAETILKTLSGKTIYKGIRVFTEG